MDNKTDLIETPCPRCNGKGKIIFGYDSYDFVYDCPDCDGSGVNH